jgi:hypothetical protein
MNFCPKCGNEIDEYEVIRGEIMYACDACNEIWTTDIAEAYEGGFLDGCYSQKNLVEAAYRNGYVTGKQSVQPVWIDTNEQVPEYKVHHKGTPLVSVLVCLNNDSVFDGQYVNGHWEVFGVEVEPERVTHWMYYPEPPGEEL